MVFADAFKEMSETIALAIDHHFPLVETHYGPGMMNYVVRRMQEEGERQARRILDAFEEERQQQKLVYLLNNSFRFLMQTKSQKMRIIRHANQEA